MSGEKKPKMLSPRKYAELKSVPYPTVMYWLRNGKIETAIRHTTATGHYYEVPETAPLPKLSPGRPGKAGKKGSKK